MKVNYRLGPFAGKGGLWEALVLEIRVGTGAESLLGVLEC